MQQKLHSSGGAKLEWEIPTVHLKNMLFNSIGTLLGYTRSKHKSLLPYLYIDRKMDIKCMNLNNKSKTLMTCN